LPGEKKTFELKVLQGSADLFKQLFEEVPELRTACIIYDWEATLNEAVPPGLWINKNGVIELGNATDEQILGSMTQTLRMFHQQVEMGLQLVEVLGKTIEHNRQQAELVQGKLDEQKQQLSGLATETQQRHALDEGVDRLPDGDGDS
jgi:hypothetical protein